MNLKFRVHFSFSFNALYRSVPDSSGDGDERCREIDAADPGAVPGGSTKTFGQPEILTGPNQDRRVSKDGVFARPEYAVKAFKTTSANDNEALAIAA